jgi:60 kDa SS-A/Ro ribonucleoprotein
LFKRAKDRELATPDTWEVALSAGADKKESFTRLLTDGKLGYLALLRNLRNMEQAGVDSDLVEKAILARKGGAERVLPFRYVAAARAAPRYEPVLDQALVASIEAMEQLDGLTIVLVDVSSSMHDKLSGKSDMTRMDAAATLASVIPGKVRVFTFSNKTVEIPPRRGMAGVEAVIKSQPHMGTYLGQALMQVYSLPHDRIIVITDEQTADRVADPVVDNAYMINVAAYQNGVGYGRWTHIDGFSESVLRFIAELERAR